MSNKAWIIVLTILFETATCVLRFGFDFETTRDTAFLSLLTFGFRIHHSYVGVLTVLLSLYVRRGHMVQTWAWRLGWALVASDLIHHFLVLWPLTGDPQVDLNY
ncbi:MAG: hypothetical protein ACI97A_003319 [Planctomycetota bacterium]|jgi:hypothetical protein